MKRNYFEEDEIINENETELEEPQQLNQPN